MIPFLLVILTASVALRLRTYSTLVLPNLIPLETLEEALQWNADTGRLLKIALRNHDPETLKAVYTRISDKHGDYVASQSVCAMITHLMFTENWSWELPDGSPSPLI